jgi:hypothetical protein
VHVTDAGFEAMVNILARRSATEPRSIAFIQPGMTVERITYRNLEISACRIAAMLLSL